MIHARIETKFMYLYADLRTLCLYGVTREREREHIAILNSWTGEEQAACAVNLVTKSLHPITSVLRNSRHFTRLAQASIYLSRPEQLHTYRITYMHVL